MKYPLARFPRIWYNTHIESGDGLRERETQSKGEAKMTLARANEIVAAVTAKDGCVRVALTQEGYRMAKPTFYVMGVGQGPLGYGRLFRRLQDLKFGEAVDANWLVRFLKQNKGNTELTAAVYMAMRMVQPRVAA